MSKKIWIDMTNSPHVLFFEPLIKILKKKAMKSDLKMKVELARTLLRFEPEWSVLNGITDMVKEL